MIKKPVFAQKARASLLDIPDVLTSARWGCCSVTSLVFFVCGEVLLLSSWPVLGNCRQKGRFLCLDQIPGNPSVALGSPECSMMK